MSNYKQRSKSTSTKRSFNNLPFDVQSLIFQYAGMGSSPKHASQHASTPETERSRRRHIRTPNQRSPVTNNTRTLSNAPAAVRLSRQNIDTFIAQMYPNFDMTKNTALRRNGRVNMPNMALVNKRRRLANAAETRARVEVEARQAENVALINRRRRAAKAANNRRDPIRIEHETQMERMREQRKTKAKLQNTKNKLLRNRHETFLNKLEFEAKLNRNRRAHEAFMNQFSNIRKQALLRRRRT